MKVRILLSALLAVVFTLGTSNEASAYGRGHRYGRARVVGYCAPAPRYCAPIAPRYCAPPVVYVRPRYALPPRCYSQAYPRYRPYGNARGYCR